MVLGYAMQRLLYLLGMLGLLSAGGLPGVWSSAAHQGSPGQALMPVRLCTSLPFGHPSHRPLSQGIDNSVILATEQWRSRFRAAHLDLLPPIMLDDGGSATEFYDLALEKANARSCAHRHDILGYIGPLNSNAAFISEPILNRSAMLQISPSTTYPLLTSPATRKSLEPATYSHRLAYPTFYRPVTTDALLGPADAAFMRERLHALDYFLVDDSSPFGKGVAGEAQAYATRIGLRLVGTGHLDPRSSSSIAASAEAVADIVAAKQPDAVFCGCAGSIGEGAAFAGALRRRGYSGPLIGLDALWLGADFLQVAGTGATNSYASDEGLDPAGAPKAFRSAYRRRFHLRLQFYDALAYDAANIALNAIYQASTAGRLRGSLFQMRAAILPYVAHVRWHGAAGVTTFDPNGDTRNRIVSMYAVRNGRWLFAGKAPEVLGVNPAS